MAGLAILALAGGGLATRVAGALQQGHHGGRARGDDHGRLRSRLDHLVTTTTTTTTVPGPRCPTRARRRRPRSAPSTSTTAGGPAHRHRRAGRHDRARRPRRDVERAADHLADSSTSTTTTVPSADPDVEAPQAAEAPPEDWPIRAISFPVAGPITYYDDWARCRGGADCPRRHIGNDLIGRRCSRSSPPPTAW
jgi:hypothetical protein